MTDTFTKGFGNKSIEDLVKKARKRKLPMDIELDFFPCYFCVKSDSLLVPNKEGFPLNCIKYSFKRVLSLKLHFTASN